jgi:hypothetical protein
VETFEIRGILGVLNTQFPISTRTSSQVRHAHHARTIPFSEKLSYPLEVPSVRANIHQNSSATVIALSESGHWFMPSWSRRIRNKDRIIVPCSLFAIYLISRILARLSTVMIRRLELYPVQILRVLAKGVHREVKDRNKWDSSQGPVGIHRIETVGRATAPRAQR